MKLLPSSLKALVGELSKLPGVGEKTALRYAVSLIRGPHRAESLMRALEGSSLEISFCPTCFYWTDVGTCPLCTDSSRTTTRLCIVRDAPDVLALEKFKSHPWKYHVLQGLLSPLNGVGPSQLKLDALFRRIEAENVQEVILAFDATVEGDATALFIRDHLRSHASKTIALTRTAMGLPAGAAVEYLDPSTLENALVHRTAFD